MWQWIVIGLSYVEDLNISTEAIAYHAVANFQRNMLTKFINRYIIYHRTTSFYPLYITADTVAYTAFYSGPRYILAFNMYRHCCTILNWLKTPFWYIDCCFMLIWWFDNIAQLKMSILENQWTSQLFMNHSSLSTLVI